MYNYLVRAVDRYPNEEASRLLSFILLAIHSSGAARQVAYLCSATSLTS